MFVFFLDYLDGVIVWGLNKYWGWIVLFMGGRSLTDFARL